MENTVWFSLLWVMGILAPMPILTSKVYMREAGIFVHEDAVVYSAGQDFLWLEWGYFVFITVAIWHACVNAVARANQEISSLGADWSINSNFLRASRPSFVVKSHVGNSNTPF